ncbi:MAG: gamma-glutamyl-gamma-aminobutyrate hydrolase family protein [Acidobacteria bacterium]|nr:gamma-glutamyl-gamma-aminobutyrate hydrolase family protein [Acidobacteriota bacterium]
MLFRNHLSIKCPALIALALALTGYALAAGPVVGLILNAEQAADLAAGKPVAARYVAAVEKAGGTVHFFVLGDNAPGTIGKMDAVDALLIPGGDDIAPDRYGQAADPRLETVEPALDALEFALYKAARDRGMPVLGICRGCQFINVFHGGTLHQDLPTGYRRKPAVPHRCKDGESYLRSDHTVTIRKGSLLARASGATRLTVNSYHHQGLDRIGRGLTVTARSADGLPEAVEGKHGPFLLGVQFHPERDFENEPPFEGIFRAFLAAAERYRAGKTAF